MFPCLPPFPSLLKKLNLKKKPYLNQLMLRIIKKSPNSLEIIIFWKVYKYLIQICWSEFAFLAIGFFSIFTGKHFQREKKGQRDTERRANERERSINLLLPTCACALLGLRLTGNEPTLFSYSRGHSRGNHTLIFPCLMCQPSHAGQHGHGSL